MVATAKDYRWSSARVRCGLACDSLLDPTWPPDGLITDWNAWPADHDETAEEAIRRHTAAGRPCGAESFVENIERCTKRSLRPKRPGRKHQERAQSGTPLPGLDV
jgi:putative transposase